jgi:aminoglycoside phosphotransferase (APT) family kinase protein
VTIQGDLDLQRLQAYAPELFPGELSAELIAGGRSNLTYVVHTGAGRLVVRRPPLGHVLATAHDMAREHRVITALAPTAIPVPATHLLCEDTAVIGAPFYVMEHVDGVPYREAAQLAELGSERTAAVVHRLVDTLAYLHDVDVEAVGLTDFGRPDGYLERQVRRWGRQLDTSRSREVPGIDELRADLARDVPDSGPAAIVHGDYRLDNVLVADDRIAAVLDWEMATVGDPLSDLALLVVYSSPALARHAAGVVSSAPLADGFPMVDDLVSRYVSRREADVARLDWYVAMAYFKLAVVLEGIHFRYTQGMTVGAGFDRIGALVAPLVAAGRSSLAQEGS